MIACVYILFVLIPSLRPRPRPRVAARLHVCRPCSTRYRSQPSPGLRLDGRVPARPSSRPTSTSLRSNNPRRSCSCLSYCSSSSATSTTPGPAIIIFMPITTKLTEVGNIDRTWVSWWITTLVLRLDHAALRIVAPRGVNTSGSASATPVAVVAALCRVLPDHRLCRRLSRHRAVVAEMAVAGICRLLREPNGSRLICPK